MTGEAKEALDLDELKALCAAATEGPWDVDPSRWSPPEWPPDTAYLRVVEGEPNPISGIRRPVVSTNGAPEGDEVDRQHYRDARFIAAARSAVPALIAEVERLTQERDEARSALESVRDFAVAVERQNHDALAIARHAVLEEDDDAYARQFRKRALTRIVRLLETENQQ